MSHAPNLLDKLEKWATETPNKIAMSFLDDKGDILRKSSMTYSDIALQSSNLAEYLQSPESNIKSGDRLAILVFVTKSSPSYYSV
jgi:acyl-CoA synthetase (AMP-forming)/AMP-acid ligase II